MHSVSWCSGFTIIELLVAIVLVGIGVLAAVATSSLVVREAEEGRATAYAVEVATNRLEWLRSHGCITEAGQATGSRMLLETWSANVTSLASRDLEDSVVFSVAGMPRSFVLQSRAPC